MPRLVITLTDVLNIREQVFRPDHRAKTQIFIHIKLEFKGVYFLRTCNPDVICNVPLELIIICTRSFHV